MDYKNFSIEQFINHARKVKSDTTSVEVKTASKALPKDIVETLSAFANGSGGLIICGLSEKDGFIPAKDFDAKRISDALAQACADKMEPPVRADIRIEEYKNALLVLCYVPEIEPFLKPCYVKARGPYNGAFIRTGEGDRHLSRYEVDRLIEERKQPSYDIEAVEGSSINDLDQELVEGFLRRERAMSPRVFAGLSDEDALLTMGVLKKNKTGHNELSLAGLMALGRHPQRYFPRANVTFVAFPGESKDVLAEDGARFLDSGTFIGPVPVMVADVLAALRRNMKVSSYIEGGSRRDVTDYPEVAIREAVANALMHRDYSPEGLGSQVQVNMFTNRIEIINPGGLYGMVTVDNIGQYGASSCRNQYLSRILESTPYPLGYPESGYVVENKGTGYAQIQAALKQSGLIPAQPFDSLSLFALTMYKKDSNGKDLNVYLHKVSNAPKNKKEGNFSEDDVLLDIVRKQGSISTSEIANALRVSKATAYRKIKSLVEKNMLVASGNHGRSTRYVEA